MSQHQIRESAQEPNDLARFFVARANAGDVDGLVALYTPDALLAGPDRTLIIGHDAIRSFYVRVLASRPTFNLGIQRPALQSDDLALTSTQLTNGTVTAEVAKRQFDGTWLWVIDQPVISK